MLRWMRSRTCMYSCSCLTPVSVVDSSLIISWSLLWSSECGKNHTINSTKKLTHIKIKLYNVTNVGSVHQLDRNSRTILHKRNCIYWHCNDFICWCASVHSTSQHYMEISQLNVLAALSPQKESPVPVRRLSATQSHSGDIPAHSTDWTILPQVHWLMTNAVKLMFLISGHMVFNCQNIGIMHSSPCFSVLCSMYAKSLQ